MHVKEQLDATIEPWNLLNHPFYRAWNEGTLPTEALKTYAAEYGSFIAGIDTGWEMVGHDEHAAEEREHAALWEQFARTLGTTISTPRVAQVEKLMEVSRRLFSDPATAWGALYAFEAQQPATAATKLTGLDAHYPVAKEGRTYFEVHADDLYEADMILAALEGANGETLDMALAGCSEMAAALWDSLTGIYDLHT